MSNENQLKEANDLLSRVAELSSNEPLGYTLWSDADDYCAKYLTPPYGERTTVDEVPPGAADTALLQAMSEGKQEWIQSMLESTEGPQDWVDWMLKVLRAEVSRR